MASQSDMEPHNTFWSHGWKKCKEQPLVPIGVLATCAALIGATRSLRRGNRAEFQKYLRLRVAAQGITVVAAVAGTLLLTDKSAQQKESRQRVLTNQLPPDPTSAGALPSSSSASPPGLPDLSASTEAAPPPTTYSPGALGSSPSARGKISTRALRQSGSMDQAQREEREGAHRAGGPMRASDFTRRLGEAERLQAEMDEGGRKS